MPSSRLFAFFACMALGTGVVSAADRYEIAPVPAWVIEQSFDPDAQPEVRSGDGSYHLLVDSQIRVDDTGEERYSHIALKVLDENGVEAAGQISVDFDPEYETLAIHSISVHRHGERLDRLRPSRLRVIQRETELESQMYDGRLTVNAVLEDVRPGDVVSYAFTVRGSNPIFGGRYSSFFYTQFSIPVDRFRYRMVAAASRRSSIKTFGGAAEPVVRRERDLTESSWARDRVPAQLEDGDTPPWYEPYPWVQISEWPSWRSVVEWALPLYRTDPAALADVASTLAATNSTDEARLLAALRFAQDEVRYVGFEMGSGSHEPRPPAQTLQQRFGDCKDKSLLLISLLEALGIRAAPVLVSTDHGSVLPSWLPSPLAFDHVLVRVDLGDEQFWVDPTLLFQRGDLHHLHQPDFGFALVVSESSEGLVEMDPPTRNEPDLAIREVIDAKAGVGRDAVLTVLSTYSGDLADEMRRYFASQSENELHKSFLNYYAATYPDIEASNPPRITSDDQRNRVVVEESYVLPSFWKPTDADGGYIAELYPEDTIALTSPPETTVRTMPLALEHPYHQVQTTEVLLPEPWPLDSTSGVIENDAISFRYGVEYADQVLKTSYTYRSKADHVRVAAMAKYMADLESIADLLGYELLHQGDDAPINWSLPMVALFAFAVGVFVTRQVYRGADSDR